MIKPLRLLLIGAAVVAASGGRTLVGQTPGTIPVATQFDHLHFRSIGPASMSGRIDDLAVYEANPAIFYVASATGGLWKTTNNGATFTPEFQDQGLMSIGDVTISQTNPDLVWIGSGESNNRQSSSWGDGVYRSTDGGAHFKNMGLTASRHINRIAIDWQNSEVVFVAAQGSLWGPGGDRGVFRTTDAGATWKNVLKVDENTGANDIVMDSMNNQVLYASMFQRRRMPCCYDGGGPGSGVWKSVDGGETWARLAGGLPTGPLGRIGLDVYRRSPNIVYALLETPTAQVSMGATGSGGPGSGVWRSDDGGQTWRQTGTVNPRPVYFTQIRVDPNVPDRVYLGGVGLHMSNDSGASVETDAAHSIHSDVHAIWIDPRSSDHLMIGDDGGVAVSYDLSKTWTWMPNLPVGQFYHVGYDLEHPFNVCGGMQDNYDWCGPSASRLPRGIPNDAWHTVQGGDGFVAIIDQRDSRIIYTESQDGNLSRRNKVTGESKSIRPNAQNVTNAQPGEPAYRFNWDTPLMFSPNDPGTLYVGANHLFKSTDRGDSWTSLSPDLTLNHVRLDQEIMGLKARDVRFSLGDGTGSWPTLVSIAESPKQPGVFFTGSDDGVVSMSRDGGKTWQDITSKLPGFPAGAWVSEVVPSRYDSGTVYVTVDNHRLNDFNTYIWGSTDAGASFHSLNANLKTEVAKTLTEDQRNPDVLYLGAETGILLSLDRGKSWQRLMANFPTVRVDEITLHPRDNAMLVATHGRSLWILDHLEPIQEYTAAQAAAADAKLFTIGPALEWKTNSNRNDEFWGHQFFVGENPTLDAVIQFALKKSVTDPKLKITDVSGKDVRTLTVPTDRNQPGIQTVCWDLRVEPISTPGGAGAAVFGSRGGGGGAGPRGANAAGAAGPADPALPQGGGAGRGRGPGPIPGVPAPMPSAGYQPSNPCGGGTSAFGVGGGGGLGFGGGSGIAGPHVIPGTYHVALVVDGKTVDAKSIKVVMDPEVQFTDTQRKRYNDMVMDLHETQRRGTQSQTALSSLFSQMADVTAKVKDASNVPVVIKTQFDEFSKEFDGIRVKFGVPAAAGAGRLGGGGGRGASGAPGGGETIPGAPTQSAAAGGPGGGGPVDNQNILARAGTVKNAIANIWEMPSDTLVKQYTEVKLALPKAIADANAFLLKAMTVSQTLKKYDITLTVPSPVK